MYIYMIVSSHENQLCYCNCSGEKAAYVGSFYTRVHSDVSCV